MVLRQEVDSKPNLKQQTIQGEILYLLFQSGTPTSFFILERQISCRHQSAST